jgi:hypothetical protein
MKKIYIDKRVTVTGKKNQINTANSLDLNNHIVEVVEDSAIIPVPSYKEYVATISQKTINPPIAIELSNTLSSSFTWSYDSVGRYTGTLIGEFPDPQKVVILLSSISSNLNPINDVKLTSVISTNTDTISISTATMDNTGARTLADSVLNISLIVRVYP